MDIATEVRTRRTKLRKHQAELAAAAGVTQSTISRLENGGACRQASIRVVLDTLHRWETQG